MIIAVRGSIENRSSTGAVKTRIVYRTSQDGVTFDNPVALYRSPNSVQEQTNDGTALGALFVDMVSDFASKQFVQWGVEAVNTGAGATSTEMVTTGIKLDVRRR